MMNNRFPFSAFFIIVSVLITCSLFNNVLAQNQNNVWYFGNRAGVDFNTGTPVPSMSGTMVSIEGVASVSDPITGDILFFTNGLDIWDATNSVMPNGSGLLGGLNTSSTQGVLIVPYPDDPLKYFVFTVDETINAGANGFRYSIVDMTLNAGLGDVVAGEKNILIQNNTTERLAVAPKADGSGFWVMMHERDNNIFKAFSVDASGIDLTPVESAVGLDHSTDPTPLGDATMGCMKFNHAYNKIAVALYADKTIEVFDFDNCNGIVSNPITVSTLDNPYGIEFSPDNSRLYYSLYYNAGFQGAVYQLNMDAADIAASATLVGISSSFNFQCMGSMQLAPDGKIYIAINSESWLSSIDAPNALGAACNFIDQAVLLPPMGLFPTTGLFGLPQIVPVQNIFDVPSAEIISSDSCTDAPVNFTLNNEAGVISIEWDFGDPASGANNSSATLNPDHLFTGPGTYTISAVVIAACYSDTIFLELTIVDCAIDPDTDTVVVELPCAVFMPNAFSPNADGTNDTYGAFNNCGFDSYQLAIYNRWGANIFYSNDPAIKWDGTYQNVPSPVGVYAYTLQYNLPGEPSVLKSGSVTLLR